MLNERGRRDHGGGGALYGTCLTYLTALTNSHYEPAEARSKSVTGCQPAHSENPVRLFSHGTRDNVCLSPLPKTLPVRVDWRGGDQPRDHLPQRSAVVLRLYL